MRQVMNHIFGRALSACGSHKLTDPLVSTFKKRQQKHTACGGNYSGKHCRPVQPRTQFCCEHKKCARNKDFQKLRNQYHHRRQRLFQGVAHQKIDHYQSVGNSNAETADSSGEPCIQAKKGREQSNCRNQSKLTNNNADQLSPVHTVR